MPQIVVARDEFGLVTLTPGAFRPAGGLGLQTLEVLGGVVQFDLDHPAAGVRAVLSSVDAASWWLPDVFGEPAAIEAIRIGDSSSDWPGQTELIDSAWGSLLPTVARLMGGLWIRRWWPSPVTVRGAAGSRDIDIPAIEEWLVDVELAHLASDAEQLFGGTDAASELASPHLVSLAAGLEYFTQGDDISAARLWIAERLGKSAAAVLDAVPLETVGYDELENWNADSVVEPLVLRPVRYKSQVALAAGVVDSGSTAAFWLEVHPRRVSASPTAVSWEVVHAPDGYRVVATIELAGTAGLNEEDYLYGRVQTSSGVLGMAFAREGGLMIGSVHLDPGIDPSKVRVTVYSSELGVPSRTGPTDEQIAEVRSAVLARTQALVDNGRAAIARSDFEGQNYTLAAVIFAVEQMLR